jgi:hypothetical protein
MKYSGVLDFSALPTLLVARNIKLTSISTLTSKSRRLLMPIRDELFIYEQVLNPERCSPVVNFLLSQ